MASRRNKIHPSLLRGGPGANDEDLLDQIEHEIDGDEDAEELIRGREAADEDDDEDEDIDESPRGRQKRDPRDERIEALERQIQALGRAIPPVAPAKPEPETDPFDEVDWDAELFQNPKDALKKYGKMQADKIRKELRAEYQQDQSSKSFWTDFYRTNKDLKDDHDLVESTMGKHMSDLANLPVSEAIDKLGDLTRARISRYSQRGKTKTRKVISEGAEAPTRETRRQPAEERLTVKTMSDLIKARKNRRRVSAA